MQQLQLIIEDRKVNPSDESYTSSLFKKGINKIAQKVGEEAVEIVIEAKDDNDDLFLNEAADLMFHYLVLLSANAFGGSVEKAMPAALTVEIFHTKLFAIFCPGGKFIESA